MLLSRFRLSTRVDALKQSATHRTVHECINGHDNNYSVIRLFLAASVIYFHSFGMVSSPILQDHLSNLLLPITSVGGLAVEAFFFLSGLFVTQSLYNNRNILGFVVKRFFRLWPGLFVCLLVTAALICAITNPHEIGKIGVFSGFYDYVVNNSAFDISYVIPGTIRGLPFPSLNGAIHTLPLEAKMYVVLAFIGLVGAASRRSTIMISAALTMVITTLPLAATPVLSWLFPASYSHVAYTMFFAGAFIFGASKWIIPQLWHGVALALILFLAHGTPHVIAFYLLVIWAILFGGGLQWLGRVVRPRSDVSYGVYIYGWPSAQIILLTVTSHMSPYILAGLSLCLAGFFATLSWRFIEKPAIIMGKHIASLNLRGWIRFLRGAGVIEDVYAKRAFGAMCALLAVCVLMQHLTFSHAFVPVTSMPMKIRAFGPTEGKAGVPLNVQPDGSSAMWISVDSVPQEGATVVFAGHRLTTALGKDVVTAAVDQNLVAHPGEKPIFIERRLLDHVERSNTVAMHISQ